MLAALTTQSKTKVTKTRTQWNIGKESSHLRPNINFSATEQRRWGFFTSCCFIGSYGVAAAVTARRHTARRRAVAAIPAGKGQRPGDIVSHFNSYEHARAQAYMCIQAEQYTNESPGIFMALSKVYHIIISSYERLKFMRPR